jgi:uncharacterized protein (DUF1810 family)
MTLFSVIDSSEEKIFKKVIDNFFDGKFDDKTLSFLKI